MSASCPRRIVTLLACLAATPGALADVTGCWINEPGTSVIELTETDGTVRGRIVGILEPRYLEGEAGPAGEPRLDLENPDPDLRARPLAGLVIVDGLERDGDRWVDGTVYDPESGNDYSARAELGRDGRLKLRGYIGSPMFGRTTEWTAAADAPELAERMIDALAPLMPEGPRPTCG